MIAEQALMNYPQNNALLKSEFAKMRDNPEFADSVRRARAYLESTQFAVDMKAVEERAEELAKDIKAMRKIAAALWREPMTM